MTILDSIELTQEQRAAATLACDISVDAGAGSGKTKTLTARYVRLLEQGLTPLQIAAITFTDKAAREMRNRIRAQVYEYGEQQTGEAREQWQTLAAGLDSARISTIHSLCAAILRAHAAEAEIDPQFAVWDDTRARVTRLEIASDTVIWAADQAELPALFDFFETAELELILRELLEKRLDAESAFGRSPDQDVERGWNYGLEDALRTYTEHPAVREAIDELRALQASGELLADAGDKLTPQVETLLAKWDEIEYTLENREPLRAAEILFSARRQNMAGNIGKKQRARALTGELRVTYDEVTNPWLGGKESGDEPPSAEIEGQARAMVPLLGALFEHARAEYQHAKEAAQGLDFDDLEALTQKVLQRPAVRAQWQTQLKAILVDEFQDTNERQRAIIEALAGDQSGALGRLLIVGDPKQSIYRFRGADVTVFHALTREILARGGQEITLDKTFRAHTALVAGMNELLANVMGDELDPARPYAIPFRALHAAREQPRHEKVSAPYIEFLLGRGEEPKRAAAQLLAVRLHEMHAAGEIGWGDVALLFRASTGFAVYEDALEEANIPFVTTAGRGFYDRPEVRDVLNFLRALADLYDDAAMAGLLRSPAFGVTDTALYQLRWDENTPRTRHLVDALDSELASLTDGDRAAAGRARVFIQTLRGRVDRVPVAELLTDIFTLTNYPALLAALPRGARLRRNLDKLLSDAHQTATARVSELLERLDAQQKAGTREGEAPAEADGAVRLMSIHRAKGLQFPVVVLADAARKRPYIREHILFSRMLGVVPRGNRVACAPLIFEIAKQEEEEVAAAEDVRLLYVAATRAEDKWIVSAPLKDANKSWLGALTEAAGISLDAFQDADEGQTIELVCGEKIAVRTQAGVEDGTTYPLPVVTLPALELERPLYEPVLQAETFAGIESAEALDALQDLERRAQRLTSGARTHDGRLVGDLFHAAVCRWRFPNDPALDTLLSAAARDAGFIAPAALAETMARVKMLLARLQDDPRWGELDRARRYHETPYSYKANERVTRGVIDLLYADADTWHIIDFKTEELATQHQATELIKHDYDHQMFAYQGAVRELLNAPAEVELCFLDLGGKIVWQPLGQDGVG